MKLGRQLLVDLLRLQTRSVWRRISSTRPAFSCVGRELECSSGSSQDLQGFAASPIRQWLAVQERNFRNNPSSSTVLLDLESAFLNRHQLC